MYVSNDTTLDASRMRIGIAVSRYHAEITEALCEAAVETFRAAGGIDDAVVIAPAPGAFELTYVASTLAHRADVDGVVALGCILRGETMHDTYLAQAVAIGLTRLALDTGKPIGFGVLTCQTRLQARSRAGGSEGNKGQEAMAATIEAIATGRAFGAIAS